MKQCKWEVTPANNNTKADYVVKFVKVLITGEMEDLKLPVFFESLSQTLLHVLFNLSILIYRGLSLREV